MDIIPSEAEYALLLLFGAVAVAVHATALYATPLSQPDDDRLSPLLERVALASIGGPRSYGKGLFCYLAITEFLYLVLSFSSVILDLSLSVTGVEGSVGALMTDPAEVNPLTPMLASSVIMTVGGFRPFAQVENAIRRLSHHVAGIPHGVYEALGRVQTFAFDPEPLPPSRAASSASTDDAGDESHPADSLPGRAEAAARAAGMDEEAAAWLADDLLSVRRLGRYSHGRDGERSWSQQSFAALSGPLQIVVPRQAAFEERVKTLLAGAPTTKQSGPATEHLHEWRSIAREAIEIKKDLALLFALLTINQSVLRVPEDASEMRTMVGHVARRPTGQDFNLLVGATLLGLVLAILPLLAYHVVRGPAGDLFGYLFQATETRQPMPDAIGGWGSYLFGNLQSSLNVALRDTVVFGLIFFAAAAVGLSLRSSRIASLQWTFWREGAYPFRQYLSVGIMAMLIAFLFYTLATFWSLVVHPSLGMEGGLPPPSLLRDFLTQYAKYVLVPSIGLICACYVCFIADRHETSSAKPRAGNGQDRVPALSDFRLAVGFATCCGLVNTLVRIENGSVTGVGSALDALLVPGAILCSCFYLYAWLHRRLRWNPDRQAGGEAGPGVRSSAGAGSGTGSRPRSRHESATAALSW